MKMTENGIKARIFWTNWRETHAHKIQDLLTVIAARGGIAYKASIELRVHYVSEIEDITEDALTAAFDAGYLRVGDDTDSVEITDAGWDFLGARMAHYGGLSEIELPPKAHGAQSVEQTAGIPRT